MLRYKPALKIQLDGYSTYTHSRDRKMLSVHHLKLGKKRRRNQGQKHIINIGNKGKIVHTNTFARSEAHCQQHKAAREKKKRTRISYVEPENGKYKKMREQSWLRMLYVTSLQHCSFMHTKSRFFSYSIYRLFCVGRFCCSVFRFAL